MSKPKSRRSKRHRPKAHNDNDFSYTSSLVLHPHSQSMQETPVKDGGKNQECDNDDNASRNDKYELTADSPRPSDSRHLQLTPTQHTGIELLEGADVTII